MIKTDIHVAFTHRVLFTRDAFDVSNATVSDLLSGGVAGPCRVLVFIDAGVAAADPKLASHVAQYAEANEDRMTLAADPVTITGGEACKNDFSLVERIWTAINDAALDRHSAVFVIGGGAFLDLVCFAASTAHRGVRHVRFPTTTLSQGDGGVGVKNGVNFFGKKNWVGTFTVPFAIVNDFAFLDHLSERDRRAGIIEAIKVALIRDAAFYEEMESMADDLARLESDALERVVRRSAELHVEHIAGSGDPFEMGSARPLDFGHWAAHKLEQVSDFRIGHGEAVAIGMAIDLVYSSRVGILKEATAERILALIGKIGFPLFAEELLEENAEGEPIILAGLEEFREHLGGELTITLAPEIGQKLEVHEMDREEIVASLRWLKDWSGVAVS